MECDFFSILVCELARGQLADAGLKRRALEHASQCSECGRQLSEAQELSASLSGLGATDSNEQAPARVEAALVGCVREQRRARRAQRRRVWLAAAAVVAIVAGGLAVRLFRQSLPVPHNSPAVAGPSIPALTSRSGQVEEAQRANLTVSQPRHRFAAPLFTKEGSKLRLATAPAQQDSGFILLPYGEDAPLPGGAQIVHVAVTPAALAMMGVAVPDAASEAYIKADVVVGDDGMARAIRLAGYSGQ